MKDVKMRFQIEPDFPDLTPTRKAAELLKKRFPDFRLPIDNRNFLFLLDTDSGRVAERTIRLAMSNECEVISYLDFRKRTVSEKQTGNYDFSKLSSRQPVFVLVSGTDLVDNEKSRNECYRHICQFVQFRKADYLGKTSAPLSSEGKNFNPGNNYYIAFFDTEPASLKKLSAESYWIDYPPLKPKDLLKIFETYQNRNSIFHNIEKTADISLGSETLEWYDNMLKGLSEKQVWEIVAQMRRAFQMGDIHFEEKEKIEPIIAGYKNRILRQHGRLEIIKKESKNLEGVETVSKWLDDHRNCVKEGTEKLTGILMVGIPGTGKSATAHMTADKFDLPLVRLEMSKILGGRVGDSEKGMQEVLQDLRIAAPCVLWIDEIEKAMSGADGNDGNGVMQRLFGMLLTFMQENDRPVFTVATANDISKLPPEFFRNGRFEATFCAMMPDYRGCRAIMKGKLNAMFSKLLGSKDSVSDTLAEKLLNVCIGLKGSNVNIEEEDNIKFLTGADIEAHVKELYWELKAAGNCSLLNDEELLVRKMKEVSKNVRAQANLKSPSSMMKLAKSYLTMMQNDMTMASSRATPYCSENLNIENMRFFREQAVQNDPYGENNPSCLKKLEETAFNNVYDKLLYSTLGEYMAEIIIQDEKLTPYKAREEFWEYKTRQFWKLHPYYNR